jgi:hypothetical protein
MNGNTEVTADAPVTEQKRLPFTEEQRRRLKRHYILLAVEVVAILILVASRGLNGGWRLSWNALTNRIAAVTGQETVKSTSGENTVVQDFVAPDFEASAVYGEPTVDESLGWSELAISDGYVVHVCGVLNADADGSLPVWLSSEADNEVWVKLRILDEYGDTLGETGILKPGEYVERVQLSDEAVSGSVTLQIMGYEPETYYSAGSVGLATNLNIAE